MGKEIDDSIEPLGQRGDADFRSQRFWMEEWRQDNINDGVFYGLLAVGFVLFFSGFVEIATAFAVLAIAWMFFQPSAHVKVVPRKFRKR